MTYYEIEATLGFSYTSIYEILHEHLAMKNICSCWITHDLTKPCFGDVSNEMEKMLWHMVRTHAKVYRSWRRILWKTIKPFLMTNHCFSLLGSKYKYCPSYMFHLKYLWKIKKPVCLTFSHTDTKNKVSQFLQDSRHSTYELQNTL